MKTLLAALVLTTALPLGALPALADDTTLSVWTRLTEASGKPMFDAFEKAHPDIKLDVQYIPGGKDEINKLVAAVAAGNAPDVAALDVVATEQFARLEALRPLDDIIAKNPKLSLDLFPAGAVKTGQFDGKQYALPFGGDASAVVYNKKLFREVGLDPENPPKTWDEFIATAQKLTFDRDKDGTTDVYGFSFVPSQAWLTTYYWLPYFWMAGGQFNDRDALKCTFNDAGGVKALTYLMDLNSKYHVISEADIGAQASNDDELAFLQGRVAMLFDGAAINARIARDAPDFELGVMQHPSPDANTPSTSFGGGDNIVVMDNIDDAKVPAATTLLEFLTSPEGQKIYEQTSAYTPVRKEVAGDDFYKSHPNSKAFLDAFLNAHEPPRTSHYVEVQQYLRDAFSSVAFGQATPQDALNTAAQRCDDLVARTKLP
ncbi:MAG TPA: ABC transporter substrate-binding protein [Devosiaceae bacterium]|jgi:multiple sugar transport system substrate-binding protein